MNTLKQMLAGGHVSLGEVRKIAKGLFDGKTTGAGPEGYIITAVDFDDLPDHVQGFIVKAILEFKVKNILEEDEADEEDPIVRATDGDYRTAVPGDENYEE